MAIITRNKTKTELIQYLHGCCFRPTPRIFLKAINNGKFLTCPGLKSQQLLKYLPPRIAKSLGHIYQERRNLQYTKHVKSEGIVEKDSDFYPEA